MNQQVSNNNMMSQRIMKLVIPTCFLVAWFAVIFVAIKQRRTRERGRRGKPSLVANNVPRSRGCVKIESVVKK